MTQTVAQFPRQRRKSMALAGAHQSHGDTTHSSYGGTALAAMQLPPRHSSHGSSTVAVIQSLTGAKISRHRSRGGATLTNDGTVPAATELLATKLKQKQHVSLHCNTLYVITLSLSYMGFTLFTDSEVWHVLCALCNAET